MNTELDSSGSINNISSIVNKLPGFKKRIILKKIPRIIKEPITRKISLDIITKTSEKGMVRLIKVAAGVAQ